MVPTHPAGLSVTLDHEERWTGRCAHYCGLYHYLMDFWVQAVPAVTA